VKPIVARQNLDFDFFVIFSSPPGRLETALHGAAKIPFRISEQNCLRLSRNQQAPVIELTLCPNRRLKNLLCPAAKRTDRGFDKNTALHTRSMRHDPRVRDSAAGMSRSRKSLMRRVLVHRNSRTRQVDLAGAKTIVSELGRILLV
jgi:hypothetical protein